MISSICKIFFTQHFHNLRESITELISPKFRNCTVKEFLINLVNFLCHCLQKTVQNFRAFPQIWASNIWLRFRLKSVFTTAPAASKKRGLIQKWSKVIKNNSKIIILLCLYTLSQFYKHFTNNVVVWKCYMRIFSAYSLSLYFSCQKTIEKTAVLIMFMKLTPGVNFKNILCATFTTADPKSAKRTHDLTVIFALLGSAQKSFV